MEREQMTELHFGCDPACQHREAILEDPYWLMRYERAQVEVSHHGIDGYGMGLYEKKD
jgi:hypothetical protein